MMADPDDLFWLDAKLPVISAHLTALSQATTARAVVCAATLLAKLAHLRPQAPAIVWQLEALVQGGGVNTALCSQVRLLQQENRAELPLALNDALTEFLHGARRFTDAGRDLPTARQLLDKAVRLAASLAQLQCPLSQAAAELASDAPSEANVIEALARVSEAQSLLAPLVKTQLRLICPGDDGASLPLATRLQSAADAILIVEDDPIWRARAQAAAKLLAPQYGFPTVEAVATANAARRWLQSRLGPPVPGNGTPSARSEGRRPKRGAPTPAHPEKHLLIVLDLGLPLQNEHDTDDEPRWERGYALAQEYPDMDYVFLSKHAELPVHLGPLAGVGNLDFVLKDDDTDAAREQSEERLRARIEDHLAPLVPENCRLDILDFTGRTVVFNGVQVDLKPTAFGLLRIVAQGRQGVDEVALAALLDDLFSSAPGQGRDEFIRQIEPTMWDHLLDAQRDIRAELARHAPIPRAELLAHQPSTDYDYGNFALRPRTALYATPEDWRRDLPDRDEFRVLVVEDEPDYRDLLTATLERVFPGQVVAVSDGAGVSEALRQSFQAAVLDLEFPAEGTDGPQAGLDAHRRLIAQDALERVVVYSRHDNDEVRRRLEQPAQEEAWRRLRRALRTRPPRLIPKTGDREREVAEIMVELLQARRDHGRRAVSSEPLLDAKPEISLPRTVSSEPRFAFIVDGRWTHCRGARDSRPEAQRGYALLHELAQMPYIWLAGAWLAGERQDAGILPPLQPARNLADKLFTRAANTVRTGIKAVSDADPMSILEERDRSYRLCARVRWVEDDEWQRLRAAAT